MPIRLDTILRNVEQMPNKVNSDVLEEFSTWSSDNILFLCVAILKRSILGFSTEINGSFSFFTDLSDALCRGFDGCKATKIEKNRQEYALCRLVRSPLRLVLHYYYYYFIQARLTTSDGYIQQRKAQDKEEDLNIKC